MLHDVSFFLPFFGFSTQEFYANDCYSSDPMDRPTADTLLRAPFCFSDPHYNFLDTDLYAKIRGAF